MNSSWIALDCSKRLDQSQCGIRITLPPREEEQQIEEEEKEESQQVWKILNEFLKKTYLSSKGILSNRLLESKYISNPIFCAAGWVSSYHDIYKCQRSALPSA